MMSFLNPFAKHDASEFPDVLIPLDQYVHPTNPYHQTWTILLIVPAIQRAVRHHSVTTLNNERRSSVETGADKEKGEQSPRPASLEATALDGQPRLTLESLRAEIEDDLASGGHDTAYDKKSKVINKAIQDIGMGRYQWQLFVLAGFGWFADNLWCVIHPTSKSAHN